MLSDTAPSVMPTLANIAALLDQPQYEQTVTAGNEATATLVPNYPQIGQTTGKSTGYRSRNIYFGGANFLAGQNPAYFGPSSVLGGDEPAQLIRDPAAAQLGNRSYSTVYIGVSPTIELDRHAGLHVGDSNPARIIALTGDVSQGGITEANASQQFAPNFSTPYENITKAAEIYAGQDVVDLALIGQNNNATDITSITAGRDVIWPLSTATTTYTIPFAVEVGGPGNLLIMSGRNVDLGSSAGIQTIGNFLDPALPNVGSSITIEVGLGSPLTQPGYAALIAQYVNPAGAIANQYAEPLQLFDANGNPIGVGAQANAYLESLPPAAQDILLNRIFFGLVRELRPRAHRRRGRRQLRNTPRRQRSPGPLPDQRRLHDRHRRRVKRHLFQLSARLCRYQHVLERGVGCALWQRQFPRRAQHGAHASRRQHHHYGAERSDRGWAGFAASRL